MNAAFGARIPAHGWSARTGASWCAGLRRRGVADLSVLSLARRVVQAGAVWGLLLLTATVHGQTPGTAPGALVESAVDTSPTSVEVVHFEPARGLEVVSRDGESRLRLWTRLQFRGTAVLPADQGSRTLTSGEVRRASVFVDGTFFDRHNYLFLQAILTPRELAAECVSPGDSAGCRVPVTHAPVFDAFVVFSQLEQASLRVGLFKPFYSRQFIAPWGGLAFVDRSVADGELRLERDVGLDVSSQDLAGLGQLRYHLGLFVGHGRDNVSAQAAAPLATARLEWMPAGLFAHDIEADLRSDNRSVQLQIAVAGALQSRALRTSGTSGPAPTDGGTTNLAMATADGVFRWRGLSLEGAWYVRQSERVGGAPSEVEPQPALEPGRDARGWYGQASVALGSPSNQLGVRSGAVTPMGGSLVVERREVGVCASHYLRSHDFKVQADYHHYWFPTASRQAIDEVRLQLQVTL